MPSVSAAQSPAVASKRYIPPTRVVLALDASGNGTSAITFSPAFDNIPPSLAFLLVGPLAANGTLSAASVTKSGFTLTMTGCTDLVVGGVGQNCETVFSVHESL